MIHPQPQCQTQVAGVALGAYLGDAVGDAPSLGQRPTTSGQGISPTAQGPHRTSHSPHDPLDRPTNPPHLPTRVGDDEGVDGRRGGMGVDLPAPRPGRGNLPHLDLSPTLDHIPTRHPTRRTIKSHLGLVPLTETRPTQRPLQLMEHPHLTRTGIPFPGISQAQQTIEPALLTPEQPGRLLLHLTAQGFLLRRVCLDPLVDRISDGVPQLDGLLGLLGELLAGSSGGGGADLLHEHLHGVPPLQNRPHTHHTTRTTSTGAGTG